MVGSRPDRRVGRTRRRLKEALLELIRERRYDEITVREIAERADVGRSTFYSHFASKEDLLFDGFEEWLVSMAESPSPGSDPFGPPLLEHVRSQRRFFRTALAGGRNARVRRKTRHLLARAARIEMARELLSAGGGRTEDQRVLSGDITAASARDDRLLEATAHCVAGAFLGLISWWLEDSRRLEPADVDRVFRSVVGSRERCVVPEPPRSSVESRAPVENGGARLPKS